jgi:hypothetical protein
MLSDWEEAKLFNNKQYHWISNPGSNSFILGNYSIESNSKNMYAIDPIDVIG